MDRWTHWKKENRYIEYARWAGWRGGKDHGPVIPQQPKLLLLTTELKDRLKYWKWLKRLILITQNACKLIRIITSLRKQNCIK